MIEKFKKSVQEASEFVRKQAYNLGEGMKDKSYALIEEWLMVFPKLELMGLEITSFALSIAISPALEVEFRGNHADFQKERLQELMEKYKNSTALTSVLTTINTTYYLHKKIYADLKDPLILKIKIKISPEIKVFIGEPIIQ